MEYSPNELLLFIKLWNSSSTEALHVEGNPTPRAITLKETSWAVIWWHPVSVWTEAMPPVKNYPSTRFRKLELISDQMKRKAHLSLVSFSKYNWRLKRKGEKSWNLNHLLKDRWNSVVSEYGMTFIGYFSGQNSASQNSTLWETFAETKPGEVWAAEKLAQVPGHISTQTSVTSILVTLPKSLWLSWQTGRISIPIQLGQCHPCESYQL